ncbi:MAG: hypothetical protein KDE27_15460 [Planctomycetes bacterium]|nr:hypothetical protein [Planctomycetota bacterium]
MHRHHPSLLLLALPFAGCAVSTPTSVPSLDAFGRDGPAVPVAAHHRGPVTTPAAIQERSNSDLLHAGDVEVLAAGTGGNDEDFEVGAGALALAANVYINDHGTAAIVRQGLSFADPGPGPDNWDGSTRVGIQQTFETGIPLMPYVGASLGRIYGDTVKESWTAGPEAGVKWYLKREAFLSLGVEYQFLFDKDDRVGDVAENGNFIYLLGFGLKF